EFIGYTTWSMDSQKNRDARFGIALKAFKLPKFWRKGYAREALSFLVEYERYGFRLLAFHIVSLEVFGNNKDAVELYKKMRASGFVTEQRKAIWLDGKWLD
ncbi:hypothetical protein BT96DRAFT_758843, partial [Gymnopus androsaceus JB14]